MDNKHDPFAEAIEDLDMTGIGEDKPEMWSDPPPAIEELRDAFLSGDKAIDCDNVHPLIVAVLSGGGNPFQNEMWKPFFSEMQDQARQCAAGELLERAMPNFEHWLKDTVSEDDSLFMIILFVSAGMLIQQMLEQTGLAELNGPDSE